VACQNVDIFYPAFGATDAFVSIFEKILIVI
jgi:hypothetical protein